MSVKSFLEGILGSLTSSPVDQKLDSLVRTFWNDHGTDPDVITNPEGCLCVFIEHRYPDGLERVRHLTDIRGRNKDKDIHGNSTKRDGHGNRTDRDVHGNPK